MTKDEIKQIYSMSEIVERYGFKPNRSGFIRCPFHPGDKTASKSIRTISTVMDAELLVTFSNLSC